MTVHNEPSPQTTSSSQNASLGALSDGFDDLLAQRQEIERKINETRIQNLAVVVARIKELMGKYGIAIKDICPEAEDPSKIKRRKKPLPKYRNPETGDTWTGRGVVPKWLSGQDRSKFEI